tara:strand:+ start:1334 stop:1870 length:537 start_codon:yes stop_codon:yes gene_type:complete
MTPSQAVNTPAATDIASCAPSQPICPDCGDPITRGPTRRRKRCPDCAAVHTKNRQREWRREYNSRPEVKARKRERAREYSRRPKVAARERERNRTLSSSDVKLPPAPLDSLPEIPARIAQLLIKNGPLPAPVIRKETGISAETLAEILDAWEGEAWRRGRSDENGAGVYSCIATRGAA